MGLSILAVACAPTPATGDDDDDDAVGPDAAAGETPDAGLFIDSDAAGPCSDVVDVVFVLDISSSMIFVLDQLDAEIGLVVDAAAGLAPEPHFGLVAFADNYALDHTGSLEGGAVHTDAASLRAAFQYHRTTYTNVDRNPGDGPGGPTVQNPICEENSNDALYGAAAEFPWRDNATRVVILVTDDTFLERPDNYGDRDGDGLTDKTDFPREGDYPAERTMAETVEALQTERARVFSFTRLVEPFIFDPLRCGTGRRLPWASISDGWSTPYNGGAPIPEQTDGANFDLEQVRSGSLSLAETINQVVLDSYCSPPIL